MAEQQEQVTQEQVGYNYNGLEISMPAAVIEPLIGFFTQQARDFGIVDDAKVIDYVKGILNAQFAAQVKAKKAVAGEKLANINAELNTQKTVTEYLTGISDALKRYNSAFGTTFTLGNLTSDSVKGTAKSFPTTVPLFAQRKGFSVAYVDSDGEDAYEVTVPLTGDMVLKRDELKKYAVEFIEGALGKDIPFAVTLDKDGKVVGQIQELKPAAKEKVDGEKRERTNFHTKTIKLDNGRGEETGDGAKLFQWMLQKGVFGNDTEKVKSDVAKHGPANIMRADDQKKYGFLVWGRDENRNYVPLGHDTEYKFGN